MEGCPSGQREQTVNLPAMPSKVQILLPPFFVAGVAQLVERQPSKLNVAGSNPVSRFRPHSSVVEHFLGKEEAMGSNPIVGLV